MLFFWVGVIWFSLVVVLRWVLTYARWFGGVIVVGVAGRLGVCRGDRSLTGWLGFPFIV